MLDEYIVEIEQIEEGRIVLVVPSQRLIVMGRTLEEARMWARSAIGWRGLVASQRVETSAGTEEVAQPPSSHAA